MLIPGLNEPRRGSSRDADQNRGFLAAEIGRGVTAAADRGQSRIEALCAQHEEAIKEIRYTGYRYMKPPGISKTLKMMHEEEAYEQELNESSMLDSPRGTATSPSDSRITPTAPFSDEENSQMENAHLSNDDEDFDSGSPDFTLPTMNASLPSMYHQG